MSNFATIFANIMTGGDELKDERIAQDMQLFGHSEIDARIVDEVIQRGIIEAARALGAALDGLTPRLVPDATPVLLARAGVNIEQLSLNIFKAAFGALEPTPGCDCKTCANTKALYEQLETTEREATAAEQAHRE